MLFTTNLTHIREALWTETRISETSIWFKYRHLWRWERDSRCDWAAQRSVNCTECLESATARSGRVKRSEMTCRGGNMWRACQSYCCLRDETCCPGGEFHNVLLFVCLNRLFQRLILIFFLLSCVSTSWGKGWSWTVLRTERVNPELTFIWVAHHQAVSNIEISYMLWTALANMEILWFLARGINEMIILTTRKDDMSWSRIVLPSHTWGQ